MSSVAAPGRAAEWLRGGAPEDQCGAPHRRGAPQRRCVDSEVTVRCASRGFGSAVRSYLSTDRRSRTTETRVVAARPRGRFCVHNGSSRRTCPLATVPARCGWRSGCGERCPGAPAPLRTGLGEVTATDVRESLPQLRARRRLGARLRHEGTFGCLCCLREMGVPTWDFLSTGRPTGPLRLRRSRPVSVGPGDGGVQTGQRGGARSTLRRRTSSPRIPRATSLSSIARRAAPLGTCDGSAVVCRTSRIGAMAGP